MRLHNNTCQRFTCNSTLYWYWCHSPSRLHATFEYVNWCKPILHGIADYIINNQQNSKRLIQIIHSIILMLTIDDSFICYYIIFWHKVLYVYCIKDKAYFNRPQARRSLHFLADDLGTPAKCCYHADQCEREWKGLIEFPLIVILHKF